MPANNNPGVLYLRVIQGPSWGNSLPKLKHLSGILTLRLFHSRATEFTVKWDVIENGTAYRYPSGCDFLVFDSAINGGFHSQSCASCGEIIGGTLYCCEECSDVYLCSMCYHSDCHDVKHEFVWILGSENGQKLQRRIGCRFGEVKQETTSFCKGAVVRRGIDWHDPTHGNQSKDLYGTIYAMLNHQVDNSGKAREARNMALVKWEDGHSCHIGSQPRTLYVHGQEVSVPPQFGIYRCGYNGALDLALVDVPSTLSYYPSHLPSVEDVLLSNSILHPAPDATAITPSIFNAAYSATVKQSDNLSTLLQQFPSLIYSTNKDDQTLLHFAAHLAQKESVAVLLRHGADPNAIDSSGDTPLHVACYCKEPGIATLPAVVQRLWKAGADFNALNLEGHTPLFEALRRGDYDMADSLLKYRCTDVNLQDKEGRCPLSVVLKGASEDKVLSAKCLSMFNKISSHCTFNAALAAAGKCPHVIFQMLRMSFLVPHLTQLLNALFCRSSKDEKRQILNLEDDGDTPLTLLIDLQNSFLDNGAWANLVTAMLDEGSLPEASSLSAAARTLDVELVNRLFELSPDPDGMLSDAVSGVDPMEETIKTLAAATDVEDVCMQPDAEETYRRIERYDPAQILSSHFFNIFAKPCWKPFLSAFYLLLRGAIFAKPGSGPAKLAFDRMDSELPNTLWLLRRTYNYVCSSRQSEKPGPSHNPPSEPHVESRRPETYSPHPQLPQASSSRLPVCPSAAQTRQPGGSAQRTKIPVGSTLNPTRWINPELAIYGISLGDWPPVDRYGFQDLPAKLKEKCFICTESDLTLVFTCGHLICGSCLDSFLKSEAKRNEGPDCPHCRQPILAVIPVFIGC